VKIDIAIDIQLDSRLNYFLCGMSVSCRVVALFWRDRIACRKKFHLHNIEAGAVRHAHPTASLQLMQESAF
jgi:hypothetical protein